MLWDSNRRTGLKHIFVMQGSFPILRSQAKSFEEMAAFGPENPRDQMHSSSIWGTDERVAIAAVSPQFFSVLGVAPLLGRTFTASEGVAGKEWQSAHVAILSYAFWRQHYGASVDAIGRTITTNWSGEKEEITIVGVMPKGFDFPYPLEATKPDLWLNLGQRNSFDPGNILQVVGRLKAGVSLAQAQTEIHTIADRIRAQYPTYYKDEDSQRGAAQRRTDPKCAEHLVGPTGSVHFHFADWLRQCGQSLACARGVSRKGDGDSRNAGRRPIGAGPPDAGRGDVVGAGGRRAGVVAGLRKSERISRSVAAIDLHPAVGFRGAGCTNARCRGGPLGACGGSVQRASQRAFGTAQSG
jgi:hypothetical protein